MILEFDLFNGFRDDVRSFERMEAHRGNDAELAGVSEEIKVFALRDRRAFDGRLLNVRGSKTAFKMNAIDAKKADIEREPAHDFLRHRPDKGIGGQLQFATKNESFMSVGLQDAGDDDGIGDGGDVFGA